MYPNGLSSGPGDPAVTYHTATEDGFRLHTLADDSPMRFDPHCVFVEGGEQFGRGHAAFYADADTARFSFGSANRALEHIIAAGGSACLPERMIREHLHAGRLHLIEQAPRFTRKTYLIVNAKAAGGWDWLPPIIDSLRTPCESKV